MIKNLECSIHTPQIMVSVSGGETSALMALEIYKNKHMFPNTKFHFVFANTSAEDKETYNFLEKLNILLDGEIIFLERVFDKRVYIKHKNTKTLLKNGELFIELIKKYVFHFKGRSCTRELKLKVLNHYCKKENIIKQCIGIRDEENRNKEMEDKLYPLIPSKITKKEIKLKLKKDYNLSLKLEDVFSNCLFCPQKSVNKLLYIYHKKAEKIKKLPKEVLLHDMYEDFKSPEDFIRNSLITFKGIK